jgi:hypothetical protein
LPKTFKATLGTQKGAGLSVSPRRTQAAADRRGSDQWTGSPQVTSHIPIVLGSWPTEDGAVYLLGFAPPYREKNVSFSGKKSALS